MPNWRPRSGNFGFVASPTALWSQGGVSLPVTGSITAEQSFASATYDWAGGMLPDGLGSVALFQPSSTTGQPDSHDSVISLRKYSIAGDSWGTLSTIYNPGAGKCIPDCQPFIVAGPKWRVYFDEVVPLVSNVGALSKYIESTDGLTGATWGAPVTWFTPTADGRGTYFNARIQVTPNGDWVSTHGQEGSFSGFTRQEIILRSTNGGVTWTNDTNCDFLWRGQVTGVIIESNIIAVDANNWIALGRCDSIDHLQFFRSYDGGHTWTAPVSSSLTYLTGGDEPNPLAIKAYDDSSIIVIWDNRTPNARHVASRMTPAAYALQNMWATVGTLGNTAGLGNCLICRINDGLKKSLFVNTAQETATTSRLRWHVMTEA